MMALSLLMYLENLHLPSAPEYMPNIFVYQSILSDLRTATLVLSMLQKYRPRLGIPSKNCSFAACQGVPPYVL